MTAELSTPVRVSRRPARLSAVPTIAVVTVLVRLLEIRAGASPDEGGYLVVASQWHASGTSLYGNYWVDRPPLLITLFSIADFFGGLGALRVLGAIAAAATVLLLASTARRVFGRRAATWTAVVAGALLVTPMYGAVNVNGELLAVPFLALGLRCAVEAVQATDQLRIRGAALGAGVAAVAALLVKQNMADGIVFAAVYWIIAWRTRRITGRRLVDMVGLAFLGSVGTGAVMLLWAMAHGSSPLAIYQATYPFRVQAAHVIADTSAQASGIRLSHLGDAVVLSGVPLVLLAFAAFGVRRSRAPGVVWGLVAMAGWCAFSVLGGGSYWLHYLVESVPAVALAAGATSLVAPRVTRAVAGLVVASSLVAFGLGFVQPVAAPGTVIGDAVGRASRPGDTILSAFGDADILHASGLSSPYPYLWSLPSQTLDPGLTLLRGVLLSPAAPTWIVIRNSGTVTRLTHAGAMQPIRDGYHVVGRICGRSIYLRDGANRPALAPSGRCTGPVLS
ncbi:MAG: hypothetical protein JWQ32_2273 [Marmoricola sp.]|nr:hypothetical protein [Marmoricola sp.]